MTSHSQPMNETPTSPSVDETLYLDRSKVREIAIRESKEALKEVDALPILNASDVAARSRSEAPVAGEPVDITGWKLVPDQPTEGMWQAGRSADIHPGDSYSKVWRAMFEAAPNVDDCETTRATPSPDTRVREALDELQSAESTYRMCHDIDGDGHINTGRAWVKLRQAGARARSALATLPRPGAVEPQTTVDELLGQIASSDRAEAVARVRAKSPALDPATVEACAKVADHYSTICLMTTTAQKHEYGSWAIGEVAKAIRALTGKDGA